jgi:hypothetical protein
MGDSGMRHELLCQVEGGQQSGGAPDPVHTVGDRSTRMEHWQPELARHDDLAKLRAAAPCHLRRRATSLDESAPSPGLRRTGSKAQRHGKVVLLEETVHVTL